MNIVEILKDYPNGTKLYSPACGECELEQIDTESIYPIIVRFDNEEHRSVMVTFTEQGKYYATSNGECMLWPSKDNHDWESMRKLIFKPGDVVVSSLGNVGILDCEYANGRWWVLAIECDCGINQTVHIEPERIATAEEKMAFLRKLNEAGYIWNCDNNKLEPVYKENDFVVTERGSIFIVNKHREFNNFSINKHEYTMKAWLCYADATASVETDGVDWNRAVRKATPEERQRLIDGLREIGYEWTGTGITKLPKFKPGDIVVTACDGIAILDRPRENNKKGWWYAVCLNTTVDSLGTHIYGEPVRFASPDEVNRLFEKFAEKGFHYNADTNALEKIKKEHTFQPYDKVLIRDSDKDQWMPEIFSHYNNNGTYRYRVCGGIGFSQCIPYEGNEHLVGTTNKPE